MCQSGWDMLSRHLAKHSGAFCAGCSLIPLFCGWGERFSFKLVALEGSRVPSAIRADFKQLLERPGEERLTLLLPSQGSEKGSCKWLLLDLTAIWAGWSVLRALCLAVLKLCESIPAHRSCLDFLGFPTASPMTPVNTQYSGNFLFCCIFLPLKFQFGSFILIFKK